jgi:transaldolase
MSITALLKKNPLLKLEALGQSIWLDYTRRDLIASGELRRLIEEDGLRGMTSNPSIFEKAITGSANYDEDIRAMAFAGQNPNAIYETLSQCDVQAAADEFRGVYDKTDGGDGYVSLEVNPHLAHDTRGTIVEARRLWRALKRPNVFIKVPATAEGIPAIRELTSDGINVNVTLLFGLGRYRQVATAYLAGIEERVAKGQSVKQVASVASFFVSRIDSLVDPKLEPLIKAGGGEADLAIAARGEVAIANAKMAYRIYKEIFVDRETVAGNRFRELAERGARVQRLLWASTSTKNPEYSDLKYVEALIGPNTINTVPTETLRAYRAAGEPKTGLEKDMKQASRVLDSLPGLGINLDQVTEQLEAEGVDKFNQAFDKLINALKEKSDWSANQTATSPS